MKVVAKPIEMIALFSDRGGPEPLKFRITGREKSTTIMVEQIIDKHIEKLAGNNMYVFTCQSEIDGKRKKYEIKFELNTCKWMLFKI